MAEHGQQTAEIRDRYEYIIAMVASSPWEGEDSGLDPLNRAFAAGYSGPSFKREEMLKNAPRSGGCLLVPKNRGQG
jgi:hypothetical protein